MNPLHPRLARILTHARSATPAPSPRLETRVIAAWRDSRRQPLETASIYSAALACACGVLILTLVASYNLLATSANPTISLANAALQTALHP